MTINSGEQSDIPGKPGKVKRLNPEGEQQQTIMIVPVSVEVFGEIIEALEELPRKRTKLLWNHIKQLVPQEVAMKGDIS